MPKLDINKLKHDATKVFETKKAMLDYISKTGFKDRERMIVMKVRKSWIVLWSDYNEQNN